MEERREIIAEMRAERIVIGGLASFQGQRGSPRDPRSVERAVGARRDYLLFPHICFFSPFLFPYIRYVGVRDHWITAIDDRFSLLGRRSGGRDEENNEERRRIRIPPLCRCVQYLIKGSKRRWRTA